MKRIGIDVGGTNTDAVLVDGDMIVAGVKVSTSANVLDGVRAAIGALQAASGGATAGVGVVMIGTTHFVNAIVERRRLNRVAAIRLCLPAARSFPPFIDWPADLREAVEGLTFMLRGGHEVNGQPIQPLDEAAIRDAARRIAESGIEQVAVSGVFSPLQPEHELRTRDILLDAAPSLGVTLSHEIGSTGLLERENAAILNAALVGLANHTVTALYDAVAASGIEARLFLSQNDGTVASHTRARQFPIFCFASGATNSMRGASFLSGIADAIVVDVGGTTADIGVLRNGFPREHGGVTSTGGARTLFRMPDVRSLPLGGGTIVRTVSGLTLGPDSVGYELSQRSRVFGGQDLTLTDIGVADGRIAIGDAARVADIPGATRDAVAARIAAMLDDAVDRMKTDARDLPLIVVGGGAFLVPDSVRGISERVEVPHHGVANAIGAATARIGGEVDQIFSGPREEAVARAMAMAAARAVAAGARANSIETVSVEEWPLNNMTGEDRRIRVRAAGQIDECTATAADSV